MTSAQFKEFKKELKELLTKHNVSLGVDIMGDTHGIRTDFVVSSNGTDTRQHVINACSAYLHASDIRMS